MGKRVKTNDVMLERSHALADMLGPHFDAKFSGLRLGQIISALETAEADHSVEFDFGGFAPGKINSYRGYYCDLALSFTDERTTVARLLTALKAADGQIFEGYKGGEYIMDLETPVWVANYGDSHGVAVVRVDCQSWRVVLHTAMIE